MKKLHRHDRKQPEPNPSLRRSSATTSRHRRGLHRAWFTLLILTLPTSAAAQGICDRTREVRDMLMNVTGVSPCGEVTARHLSVVRAVSFSEGGILRLQAHDFSGLSGLKSLSFSNYSLSLPRGVFDGLRSLESLAMRDTPMRRLQQGIFGGLVNLKRLELSYNQLTSLPAGVFDGLGSLKHLDLSYNHLTGLPAGIFRGLDSLVTLNLSLNPLTHLSARIFDGLTSLERLDLSSTSLTRLSARVFNGLSSLKGLDMFPVDLAHLPAGIFDDVLDTLGGPYTFTGSQDRGQLRLDPRVRSVLAFPWTEQVVSAGKTVKVTVALSLPLPVAVRVPFVLGGTAPLEAYTDVSPSPSQGLLFPAGETRKDITLNLKEQARPGDTIVVTLGKEISLRRSDGTGPETSLLGGMFYLRDTAHTVVVDGSVQPGVCDRTPEVRDRLMQITGVSNCEEVTAAHLAEVTELNLRQAFITSLQADDFSGLVNLEYLSLYSSSLSNFPMGVFDGLGKLKRLDLELNNLIYLPEGAFAGLGSLEYLNLRNNDLAHLSEGSFDGLDNLKWLGLRENDLSRLPGGIFDEVLDTLGAPFLFRNETLPGDLVLDPALKATLKFSSDEQVVSEEDTVTVTVALGKPLPVAVRVPYAVSGSEASELYTSLSPSPSDGLLFPAGETQREITLTLDKTARQPGAIVLTLSGLSEIELLRSDGTGADAPYLESGVLVDDAFEGSTHTVIVTTPTSQGVCNRTPQVRDRLILNTGISGVSNCWEVTAAHLAGVRSLMLVFQDHELITSLRAHDFSGLSGLTELSMRENSLTSLPEGIFDDLTSLRKLDLFRNSMTGLPEGVFDRLDSLEHLDLSYNSLTGLPKGAFDGLGRLNELNLNGNPLASLPARIFNGLGSLEYLGLNETSLTSLPQGIFGGLSRLESLDLWTHSLTAFPAGIFGELGNLKTMQLANGPLTHLPERAFEGLSRLEFLNLAYNSLTNLPEGVFNQLSNLEHLDLSGNNVARLPEGIFDGLSQLKRLNLTRSSLTELPEGVFDHVLDTLGMPYRFGGRDDGGGLLLDADLQATLAFLWPEQMAMAGDDVSVAVSLTRPLPVSLRVPYTFHLDDGSGATDTMTELSPSPPDQLLIPAGETRSEITLALEGHIGPGDTVFLSLGELTEIGLRRADGDGSDAPYLWTGFLLLMPPEGRSHSVSVAGAAAPGGCNRTGLVRDKLMEAAGVSDCKEVTARHLEGVRDLNLAFAGIGRLQTHDFSGLVNLEHLDLTGNSLVDFPKGIFDGLSHLKSLNLSLNRLQRLPEGLFSDLGSLEILNLVESVQSGDTRLNLLSGRLFEGLGNLRVLHLSRNALNRLPEQIFEGLAKLEYLDLSRNVLVDLPAGIFRGLNQLKHLDLSGNESNRHVLNRLPEGVFDAVLDTLGGPFRLDGEIHQGKLHSSLRSTLDFSASGQTARQGTTVKVSATLSRVLPVAVRVPYAVGGTAAADAYTGLSPSPSDGLLFPAGEVRGEIVLSLSKDTSNEGKTITLTLAKAAEIGLRRSDGTGIDAPYLGLDTFTNTDRIDEEPTHVVTISEAGPGDPDQGRALFVPVILTAAGRNNSFFSSELTLTNRGSEPAFLNYTYTADAGGGSGTATDRLDSGQQKIEIDAIDYLRRLGIPIPATGNRIGTLRVDGAGSSGVGAMARTSTNVPEGRAGLAYPGVPEEEGFDEPVYLCGLRQNSRDRSNLAFQNMGPPDGGAITIRTTVYSGEASDTRPRELADVELGPGEFHQYSGLLGKVENGYVKVERVEGSAPFYAYGVINDQANSDGSFIFPVTASLLEGKRRQTLPVIVETGEFSSELTVTNFSDEPRTLDFEFVSEQIRRDDNRVEFSMTLEAGEQAIVPEVVAALRREGMAGLGRTRGVYLGPVFVRAKEGDLSGVVLGARTGSRGGGGQYSVFYNAVPDGEAFAQEAWVEGLQQNEENRSNLALVNTGEADGSESVFHLEIYDGGAGGDGRDQADSGAELAPDQRDIGQSLGGDPTRVYPDREGLGTESLPGLRGGQRRRSSGRAQWRRSLYPGPRVGVGYGGRPTERPSGCVVEITLRFPGLNGLPGPSFGPFGQSIPEGTLPIPLTAKGEPKTTRLPGIEGSEPRFRPPPSSSAIRRAGWWRAVRRRPGV